ncbi:MAG: iron-containing alcohol dehydrogenase [Chloroflexi bacterium]|nr:iron-containing alcohol dehydrogenase [Chloroflexota bacterium]
MRFEFATATRISFGPGTIKGVGSAAREMGRRALVATGRRSGPLLAILQSAGVDTVTLTVSGEPTTDLARAGTALARETGCDLVIGCGGGSAIDAGKAIAALLANGGDPLDYLEVVGRGQPLTHPSAPFIAIPTTAGAGAEVTRNAVLASPEHGVKASLRSPFMLPRLAIVDPELTYSLPPDITASTGLDALTQLIEPFTSIRANPLTDALCREGMGCVAHSLRRAYERGNDAVAREEMALASLFGGLALANAGLGAAHGFASVIGGMYTAPHGAVCAAFLPAVMAVNLQALRARQPQSPVLRRYADVAHILTGRTDAAAEDGIRWVQELSAALRVPALATYGITRADFATLVEKTAVASSTKANPVALTGDELQQILEQAL